jgi:serine/threonine protein kinase
MLHQPYRLSRPSAFPSPLSLSPSPLHRSLASRLEPPLPHPRRLFCKRFPFFENVDVVKQARLEEVADAVSNNAISYSFGPWPSMSPAGLDFIQRCLTRREQDRIGVDEALGHAWFDEFISPAERQQMARMRLGAGAAPSAAAA